MTFLFIGSIFTSASITLGATRDEYKQFCDALRGRWMGEVTWVTDWPGFGKQGDKVTAYAESNYSQDGNAFDITFYGGSGTGSSRIVFDAGAKKIRGFWVTSGGTTQVLEYRRDGDQWIETSSGSLADGSSVTYEGRWIFTEDGKQLTITGSGTVGGKPHADQHDVWHKVSNNVEIAEGSGELQEFGKQFAGRWLTDITYIHDWDGANGGKGTKVTGYEEFRWINDGKAILCTGRNDTFAGTGLFLWDPASKQIVAIFGGTDSGSWQAVIKKRASDEWVFTATGGGMRDGKSFAGASVWKFSEEGKRIDISGQITLDGELLDPLQDVYHRLSDD